MIAHTPNTHDLWHLAAPRLPAHSHLYCIEPIGIGTSFVESMTSYITRIAAAHRVPVRSLLSHEILPRCGRPYLSDFRHTRLHSFLSKNARLFNGTQTWAGDIVHTLGQLTARSDLSALTMRTWGNVLAPQRLLRQYRAWCPTCYAEWQRTKRPIYEPLLWTVDVVKVCPSHAQPLEVRCPRERCRRFVPLLAVRTQPGHCSWCQQWLGSPVQSQGDERIVAQVDTLAWELWVGDVVGMLVATAPQLASMPQRDRIAHAIARYEAHVAGGNIATFAHHVQLPMQTVYAWKRGTTVPRLDLLLQLSSLTRHLTTCVYHGRCG